MNIKQLKERIKDLPDHLDVFVQEKKSEFPCGLLNDLYVKEIPFREEPDGKIIGRAKVVLLEDI